MANIIVCGICGKMGKRIASLICADDELQLIGATEIRSCSFVGTCVKDQLHGSDLAATISSDLAEVIEQGDCVIDFTSPEATLKNIEVCKKHKKGIVIGTTGFSKDQIELIHKAGKEIPVFFTPNMSIGVNAVFDMAQTATKLLGPDYTVKIEEIHHVHKKDSPSGTAKKMAELIEDAGNGNINIEAFREGEVVGYHKIVFESPQDRIEIIHDAKTRDIFALGALEAAKYISAKPAGHYTMQDVIDQR